MIGDSDKKIDNFEKLNTIGKGADAIVYKAFDKINKRYCALKIFSKKRIKELILHEYLKENEKQFNL